MIHTVICEEKVPYLQYNQTLFTLVNIANLAFYIHCGMNMYQHVVHQFFCCFDCYAQLKKVGLKVDKSKDTSVTELDLIRPFIECL